MTNPDLIADPEAPGDDIPEAVRHENASRKAFTRSAAYKVSDSVPVPDPALRSVKFAWDHVELAQKSGWNLILFSENAYTQDGELYTGYGGFLQDIRICMWAATRTEEELDYWGPRQAFAGYRESRRWWNTLGADYGTDLFIELQRIFIEMMADYFVTKTTPLETPAPPPRPGIPEGEVSQ